MLYTKLTLVPALVLHKKVLGRSLAWIPKHRVTCIQHTPCLSMARAPHEGNRFGRPTLGGANWASAASASIQSAIDCLHDPYLLSAFAC